MYLWLWSIYVSFSWSTNKLVLCSELMIFIGYKNNSYCFMCYIQGNIIFHSTYTIFDKKLFPKYTNSHIKEHKLYDKLLDKISLEMLWCVWGLTFFFFFYLFFLILYSSEFLFLFIDDEEAHDCSHMTYHMMWGHRPRVG